MLWRRGLVWRLRPALGVIGYASAYLLMLAAVVLATVAAVDRLAHYSIALLHDEMPRASEPARAADAGLQSGEGRLVLANDDSWGDRIKRDTYWQQLRAGSTWARSPAPAGRSQPSVPPRNPKPARDRSEDDPADTWYSGDGDTYRTVCVRLCDGYYFPISFSTRPEHFKRDQQVCQDRCGGAREARLYVFRTPGGQPEEMVDIKGEPYSKLKTAFLFRSSYQPSCRCQPHPWEEAALARHRAYADAEQRRKASKPATVAQARPPRSEPPAEAPGKGRGAKAAGWSHSTVRPQTVAAVAMDEGATASGAAAFRAGAPPPGIGLRLAGVKATGSAPAPGIASDPAPPALLLPPPGAAVMVRRDERRTALLTPAQRSGVVPGAAGPAGGGAPPPAVADGLRIAAPSLHAKGSAGPAEAAKPPVAAPPRPAAEVAKATPEVPGDAAADNAPALEAAPGRAKLVTSTGGGGKSTRKSAGLPAPVMRLGRGASGNTGSTGDRGGVAPGRSSGSGGGGSTWRARVFSGQGGA